MQNATLSSPTQKVTANTTEIIKSQSAVYVENSVNGIHMNVLVDHRFSRLAPLSSPTYKLTAKTSEVIYAYAYAYNSICNTVLQ